MKHLALSLCAATACAVSVRPETIPFDDAKVGALPSGWFAGVTGQGQPKWTVETDASAPSKPNVLKQSGEGTYPWCVKADTKLTDGFVEVKFKALTGKEDQAAGVVWRWKDRDNYYIARANALEDNVRIYHFLNGKRTQFKGANLKVTPNEWHTLRVDFAGARFTVTYDGQKLFEAEDNKITGSGAVGVWTKADSVTAFDDFSYASPGK
jgi:hypothetical protein